MTQILLEEATKQRFGQEGLAAIKKYPCLIGAKIEQGWYVKEAGDNFTFHRATEDPFTTADPVLARGDGCKAIVFQGKEIYSPSKALISNKLLIGAAVLVGITATVLFLKR